MTDRDAYTLTASMYFRVICTHIQNLTKV